MHKRLLSAAISGVLALAVATPVAAAVRPVRDLLPDGDTRPIVLSAKLLAPQRHNALLEADIVIDAYDNDAVVRYEYRWSGPTIGREQAVAVVAPTVSYASIQPDSPYALDVRAIDTNNNPSDWFQVWQGNTPSVPNVIVAGDSIASGYSRDWFTADATCTDVDFSYGSSLVSEVAAGLPSQWVPTYTNIAWAGAGVEDMIDGGSDSCGVAYGSQVDQIQSLAANDTWNVVAITAGINSTNWTDVIVALTTDTTFSFTANNDRNLCEAAVRDRWNIESRSASLTESAAAVSEAITSGTNAQVLWTGYYDITDTELAPLYRPITGACSDDMEYALATLHGALRAGLDDDVRWVDIDTGVATQQWAGWPHPNPQGQATIAHRVAVALNS